MLGIRESFYQFVSLIIDPNPDISNKTFITFIDEMTISQM